MGYSFLFLPLFIVALVAAFEARLPRFTSRFKLSHFSTPLAFGLMGIGLSLLLPLTIQDFLIGLVAPFQILSIPQLPLPNWLGFILCFLLIDFAHYWLHRLSHMIPALWRLHKIHHADKNVSAATNLLHHPGELLFGYLMLLTFFVVLGMPLLVIVSYGLANQIHGILVHSNINYPTKLNDHFKYVVYMPDVHRIHHSVDMIEGNSNFGQIFPFWDVIFGTHQEKAVAPISQFKMGLSYPEQGIPFSILSLLALPVLSGKTSQSKDTVQINALSSHEINN